MIINMDFDLDYKDKSYYIECEVDLYYDYDGADADGNRGRDIRTFEVRDCKIIDGDIDDYTDVTDKLYNEMYDYIEEKIGNKCCDIEY